MSIASITITREGEADLTLTRARVRAQAITFDRAAYRAPYGDVWRTSGTRQRNPDTYTLDIEVLAASIHQAAPSARSIITALENATSIIAPLGTITPAGISSYSVSPIVRGYRLSVTVLASTALDAPALPVEPPIGLPTNLVTASGDPVTAGGEYVTHG